MTLQADFTGAFERDVKRLRRKHVDLEPLQEVIKLVLSNTDGSLNELRRRHRMHQLKGEWAGSNECHIANSGDWLIIWRTGNGIAVFERTGTHDQLFQR